MTSPAPSLPLAVVMSCYPRRSETFIAQELLGLQNAGLAFEILSLDTPASEERNAVNREITATVHYLPHSLLWGLGEFVSAWVAARRLATYQRARNQFLRDFRRDISIGRIRRFAQAMVIATRHEARYRAFHAHFLHKPASVVRYVEILAGKPWSASAHAKDIWTSPDWDLADKLEHAHWVVTCSGHAFDRLRSLADGDARIYLSYHGLDLDRFGERTTPLSARDGTAAADPVRLLSVARAVEKKGLDTLLHALALLPQDIHWRLTHVGYGPSMAALKTLAADLGLTGRITWRGSLPQSAVLDLYRESDLFVLPCRVAADGDRDGVPNVLVEAASQRLASISTTVSGVPELITHDQTGYLVDPDNPQKLADAILLLAAAPALRTRLGTAAEVRVRGEFDHRRSVAFLYDLLRDHHDS